MLVPSPSPSPVPPAANPENIVDGERGLKNGDGGADDAAAVGDDGGEVIRSDTWHGGGKPTKHKNTSRVIFGPPITPRRLSSVVSHAYWYLVSKARGSREGVHTLQILSRPTRRLWEPDGQPALSCLGSFFYCD